MFFCLDNMSEVLVVTDMTLLTKRLMLLILPLMIKWVCAKCLPNLTILLWIFLTMCVSIYYKLWEEFPARLKLVKTIILNLAYMRNWLTSLSLLNYQQFDRVIQDFVLLKARKCKMSEFLRIQKDPSIFHRTVLSWIDWWKFNFNRKYFRECLYFWILICRATYEHSLVIKVNFQSYISGHASGKYM